MLPIHDIIAWREHAGWATEAQVEQDLLITRAMTAIFADPFLSKQVAMRGGTVLHKVHLAPAARYSEDIDLVAVGERPGGHIRKALIRVLEPLLGLPPLDVLETVRLAIRNAAMPSEIIRLGYTYRPTVAPPRLAKLKIEVNITERTPVFPPIRVAYAPPVPGGGPAVELVSYDLDELLGTKLRALLQRDHGRDVFDLAVAWSRAGGAAPGAHRVTPARVIQAFLDYMKRENSSYTYEEACDALDAKLHLHRFRADLDDVLATGVVHDVDEAARVCRDVFFQHLPGGPKA